MNKYLTAIVALGLHACSSGEEPLHQQHATVRSSSHVAAASESSTTGNSVLYGSGRIITGYFGPPDETVQVSAPVTKISPASRRQCTSISPGEGAHSLARGYLQGRYEAFLHNNTDVNWMEFNFSCSPAREGCTRTIVLDYISYCRSTTKRTLEYMLDVTEKSSRGERSVQFHGVGSALIPEEITRILDVGWKRNREVSINVLPEDFRQYDIIFAEAIKQLYVRVEAEYQAGLTRNP